MVDAVILLLMGGEVSFMRVVLEHDAGLRDSDAIDLDMRCG